MTSDTQTPLETTALSIMGMSCAACQIHVQRALEGVPGVTSASVNLMAHTALVTAPATLDTATLIAAVHGSGYKASLPNSDPVAAANMATMDMEGGHLGLRALLALVAGAVSMLLAMATPLAPILWAQAALALAVMMFAAPEIYTAAWRAALHRATNMNTLVAIGTLAGYFASTASIMFYKHNWNKGLLSASYFDSVILILAFLLTGRWLEARARNRATAALRGFAQLESADARLLTGTGTDYATYPETLLPLSAIERDDIVRVLPGDRIPLDGLIVHGRSSIDESMLTGEPLPVTRSPGEMVYGGTLNLDGPLVLRATTVGADSTLAQMQRLLSQAQSSRAPMQRLADRASSVFVPAVLGIAALTFAVWWFFSTPANALSVAIAVLIIACPCAMGLAVPAAITVSLGRAAQNGLLIKGGEALERLATVDTIALDKTGTLTLGRPIIAAFVVADDARLPAETLLACAGAAERLSTHPLATAVVAYAKNERQVLPLRQAQGQDDKITVENLITLPGTGLTATVDGHRLALGNASLLKTAAPGQPTELAQATPLYLLFDDHLEASFYVTDELRPNAASAIAALRALGVQPIMLTGDIAAAALPIAQQAGIGNIRAHLLPADKLNAIRQLQQQGHRVAMAGDGINDAAALAQSDAGLAMASGSDLAREAGDILLLHPDLMLLPLSIRIARRTVRVMRQNLGWAMIYNLIGLPIAAGALYPRFHILLSPILASAAMALSSVSVLANSLRLRRLP